MDLLALYAVCLVGTIFPPVNPEVTTIGFALKGVQSPIWLALTAAAGQTTTFAIVFVGGAALVRRWARLHTLVERVRVRFASHLEERFLVLAIFGGVIGLPPAIALAALADGFGVPARHLLPVVFVGRVVRYLVLTIFARELAGWFGLA